MKILTKEWKQQYNGYEQCVYKITDSGYFTLSQWGKALERLAMAASSKTESAAKRIGLDVDLNDFLLDEILRIVAEERFSIKFGIGTIIINNYKIKQIENIDFSLGECYLAAVELYADGNNVCELHCLIGQILSDGREEYYYLTVEGVISVIMKNE